MNTTTPKKAMIFAAGTGTRLKPLTDFTPKALVPVNGRPMIEHIILTLKRAGFEHLVINVHHFADQIIRFLNTNNHFGLHIDISDEREYLMDTGGGIKQAQPFLQDAEAFLVHNVDIFSNVDLEAMYRHHLTTDSVATLLVSHRSSSRQLLFDKDHRLSGWKNSDTGEVKSLYPDFTPERHDEFAFGGIHVMSPRIFDLMDEWTGKFSIINFYLSICPKVPIRYHTATDIQLFDAGKPDTLAATSQWLSETAPPLPQG